MMMMAQPLAQHQWKDRIILLFSPSQAHPISEQQLASLQEFPGDLEDRNLLIYRISPDRIFGPKGKGEAKASKWFYDKYRVDKTQFCLILIGKDGGEKLRKNTLTTPREIFALIDSMPMRRSEMKRKNGSGSF